jgi:hypothetical protein
VKQVAYSCDGPGDCVVVELAEQFGDGGVRLAGGAISDSAGGVRAVTPSVGHAVRDRLRATMPGCQPLVSSDADSGPGDDPALLLPFRVAG